MLKNGNDPHNAKLANSILLLLGEITVFPMMLFIAYLMVLYSKPI